MDQPIIRDATEQDAELLAGLIRDSFHDVAVRFSLTPDNCPKHPSNCTAALVASDMQRNVQYFILSQEKKAVGCAGLELADPTLAYIERLAAIPDHRHQGFGRRLVEHALSQARAAGANRVSVGIISGHMELKQWYLDLGFVETGTKAFSHLPFQVAFLEKMIA